MKNMLAATLLLVLSGACQAMDAKQLKEAAMKGCEIQSASMPENMQEQTKKLCVCNVEKTDYDAVLKAQASGDTKKIQDIALENAKACSAELK
ncbi:hypothetical protein [Pseudoteredinibacter isoporae]|uniref:hypothetical protein n=1 Tax=Pseudoteredinibacter isoporae TaxID=570281 RepID=UPI003101F06E